MIFFLAPHSIVSRRMNVLLPNPLSSLQRFFVTNKMKVVVIFLSITYFSLNVNADTCPSIYLRYSQKHTFCLPPSKTCKILNNKVTAADIDIILREHNTRRSRVATGKETTKSLPEASNMRQMVWDNELAAVAQKHADQCIYKHDCKECRRVQNFGVGQNLAKVEGEENPEADWAKAIGSWYNEVNDFDKSQIDSFVDGDGPPATGHFTQMIWANSWRIGCGFTMHKEGNKAVKLYTCNYGPGGNTKTESIYTKGKACSGCPTNSCCGKSCSKGGYPGLCQISGDNPPQYNRPEGYNFYCSFNGEPDCDRTVTGVDKWKISNTLSGPYLGIVLNGGESSTTSFTKPLKVPKEGMCVTVYFRSGPNVAGQKRANDAVEIFTIPEIPDHKSTSKLESNMLGFMKNGMSLGWNMKTMMAISFSVPRGESAQYLEIKEITMKQAARC